MVVVLLLLDKLEMPHRSNYHSAEGRTSLIKTLVQTGDLIGAMWITVICADITTTGEIETVGITGVIVEIVMIEIATLIIEGAEIVAALTVVTVIIVIIDDDLDPADPVDGIHCAPFSPKVTAVKGTNARFFIPV